MPIFAVSPEIFGRFFSSYHQHWVETDAAARFLVSYQHWLFYPIMAFARFNLYAQAWLLLLSDEYVHNKVRPRVSQRVQMKTRRDNAVYLSTGTLDC